jgi:hypothetical protein
MMATGSTEAVMGKAVRLVAIALAALALSAATPPNGSAADDRARLEYSLAALQPERAGTVDAFVVVAALDSAPVFGREAREGGRVLASRFDAAGRTIVLAPDEGSDKADAAATPDDLALALARVAAVMNRDEDVLILYTTSHGSPMAGLNFRDPERGSSVLTPAELAGMLDRDGFKNRLIILQACFSGQFVPALEAPRTVVATAASAMKSSFGCTAGNDWTFFGYALIDLAMRQPDTFVRQFRRAFVNILEWERQLGVDPSSPQISVGSDTAGWLAALDMRAPKTASAPLGRPPAEIAH